MKKILITGATGALGQEFLIYFNEHKSKYQVFAPGRQNLENSLDLGDNKKIKSIINSVKPDLIIHLAATFLSDFEESYKINVLAAQVMLEAVLESGKNTRVLLIGSAAEYGLVYPEDNPISEDHVLRPISVYGITKSWQTQLAYYFESQGVDVLVARIFNLLGAGLSDRLFIGRLQKQIKEYQNNERTVIELGPLSAKRDYISIKEAVKQVIAIVKFGKSGNVYNVASGKPITMYELMLSQLSDYGLSESIVTHGPTLSNRKGIDVPEIYADVTKINDLLKNNEHNA